MAKDILHLDIGNAVTTAKAWSQSRSGLRLIGSAAVPSPGASVRADLGASAHVAYAGVKGNLAKKGESFDPDDVIVTVSAAGEPRTVCAGVVRGISGESAKRAALSGGATVTDLISVDDGRHDYQRVSDLRRQAISMVVMAGGVDEEILGSGRHQLFNVAKVVAEGLPERRGGGKKVPLIYAASQEGREEVLRIFGDSTDIIWADNVRSRLEEEHLESARNAVVSVFSDSVRHDPRFSGLGRFGAASVFPAGHASGVTVELMSKALGENVLAISLDGGAVEVYSSIRGVFTRTVTPADKVEAKDVLKWIPAAKLARSISETLGNWKSNPGVLPRTWDDLALFLGFQKECVRLALAEHSRSAIELRGIHRQRQIGETFQADVKGGDTLVRMERISAICITGFLAGILSPSALTSLVMDAVAPCGVTKVYVDRDGLIQSYGLLQGLDAALTPVVGLQPLCVVLSPGQSEQRVGGNWAFLASPGGLGPLPVRQGDISVVAIPTQESVEFELHPAPKVDLGEGEGRKFRRKVSGFSSAYIDGRPRAASSSDRCGDNQKWYRSLAVFPPDVLTAWERGRD